MNPNRPETLIRADRMMIYFRDAEPGEYRVAPDQVEIIKMFWWELHNFTGAEFSFNDNFSILVKK